MSQITPPDPDTKSASVGTTTANFAQLGLEEKEKMQSTPMSKGASAVSAHLTTTNVADWTPHKSRDVENQSKCDFLDMLKQFLIMALPENLRTDPPGELLSMCLNAVLPICNGHSEGGPNPARLQDTIRSHLMNYCETTEENKRYDPFTKAMNVALDELRNVTTPLNPVSEDGLRFYLQRHDSVPLFGRNKSMRKPDVVGTQEGVAFLCSKLTAPTLRANIDKAHENPPGGYRLAWSFAKVPAEFKLEPKPTTLPSPPNEYHVKFEFKQKPHEVFIDSSAKKAPVAAPLTGADKDYLPPKPPINYDVFGPRMGEGTILESQRDLFISSQSKKPDQDWGQAMVQVAAYAAERLFAVPGSSHAIGLVIRGCVAWVWWFDRQGAIQSGGVDFVQDLPYFLVLLLAFQRFTEQEWVRPSVLSSYTLDLQDGVTVKLPWDYRNMFIQHFGLAGRGTCIGEAVSESPDPRGSATTLEGLRLVVKLCWQETERTSEVVIIKQAKEAAKRCDKIRDHIPDLISFRDFPEVNTQQIREAFHASESHGSRHLRVLAFPELRLLTELTGKRFWTVFIQIFVCHRHLWINGIWHRDISPSNMMFYERAGEFVGVLNDFDLSSLAENQGPSGQQRTGTLPFLALDLLSKDAVEGRVKPRYRYDAESFLWALAWICICYGRDEEGVLRQRTHQDLVSWHADNLVTCRGSKNTFLFSATRPKSTTAHEVNFARYEKTLEFQRSLYANTNELSDNDIYEGYMKCFGEEVEQSCACVDAK